MHLVTFIGSTWKEKNNLRCCDWRGQAWQEAEISPRLSWSSRVWDQQARIASFGLAHHWRATSIWTIHQQKVGRRITALAELFVMRLWVCHKHLWMKLSIQRLSAIRWLAKSRMVSTRLLPLCWDPGSTDSIGSEHDVSHIKEKCSETDWLVSSFIGEAHGHEDYWMYWY